MEALAAAFLEPARPPAQLWVPRKAHWRPGLVPGLSHLEGWLWDHPLWRLAVVKVTISLLSAESQHWASGSRVGQGSQAGLEEGLA